MTSIADVEVTTREDADSNLKSKSASVRPESERTNFGVGWNVVRTLGEGQLSTIFT